jgi:predicted MPP superfamily phosphohydrolase
LKNGENSLKRRELLILSGAIGLGSGIATHQIFAQSQQIETENCLEIEAIADTPLLRFASVGDVGTGSKEQYAIAEAIYCYAQKNPFPFILLTGDNIYQFGEIERVKEVFERPYAKILAQNIRFRAVLGNHDIDNKRNGDDEIAYAGYNMSGRYYSFSHNPVDFFALDTNTNATWKEELKWLERKLSASKAKWKVVFGHHPLYSSGRHGSSQELIDRLSPVFAKYGVQLYICGHDHCYERTQPIEGTTYVVCGGGGAGLYGVSRSEWTAYSESRHCFAIFDVSDDRLDIRGIGTDGKVFDRGTISLV